MAIENFLSIVNSASALSIVAELQSAESTPERLHIVSPPTYANAASNGAGYLLGGFDGESHAENVRLDSPQSMAHRLTEILRDRGITSNIIFRKPGGSPLLTREGNQLHSSMLSHRASDAILQDSKIEGVPFRDSKIGKSVLYASKDNAGAWWQYFPEVLLFGFWDSFSKYRSGTPHGAKVARSFLAEIYGYDVRLIPGGATKVDLIGVNNSAGKLYLDEHFQVSLAAAESAKESKQEKKSGKQAKANQSYKPSELGHGGIVQKDPKLFRRGDTPARPRGVAVRNIVLQGYISLNYLQGFRFGDNEDLNQAIRTGIAAAGLASLYTLLERGMFLRSGTQLQARSAILHVERGLRGPEEIEGSSAYWIEIYQQAADRAAELGLPRISNVIEAEVSDAIVKAIADSTPEGDEETDDA